jgi:hypothetical protein
MVELFLRKSQKNVKKIEQNIGTAYSCVNRLHDELFLYFKDVDRVD